MRVRAGVVYQIISGTIKSQHYREIIFWSNWMSTIKFYYDAYNIKMILTSGIQYKSSPNFNIEQFFGKYSQQLLDLFTEYDLELILGAASYYIYEYSYYIIDQLKKFNIGDPVITWYGTTGLNMERSAKIILSEVYGYNVCDISRGEITLGDVVLTGKADGIIETSPGNLYNGWVIELKYSPSNSCNIKKNQVQIACYYKIYNRPVILAIYTGISIKLYAYNMNKLSQIWDNTINEKLLTNCQKIKDQVNIDSIIKIPKLVKLLT